MMQRKRRALVVGFDYYGRFLCSLMNEHSQDWTFEYHTGGRFGTLRALLAARSADAIIAFGGPGPNAALAEIARSRRIPVIVIWAGSDVQVAQRDPHLLELLKRSEITNVSDGPWLVDELRELGITATYVPVTAVTPAETIAPLPKRFSVLTYLPEPRRAFYGEKAVYAIAREFPDVPFRVVGRGHANPVAPKNVEFLGYVEDMPQRIDDATVLLRLPEHDGKSMLVVETMARARHVVWNYPFEGALSARNIAEACACIRALYDAHQAGALEPNKAGYDYVRAHFTRQRLAAGFLAVVETAASPRPAPERSRNVAISGLTLFSAHLIEQAEKYVPSWRANFMRTSVRLEVFTSLWTLLRADVWYSIGAPIGDRAIFWLSRVMRKPRVIHWVGSDIAMLYRDARLRAQCRNPHVRNLAEVEWTVQELAKLGVTAHLAPLPPHLPAAHVSPLPEHFTILLYIPRSRGEFYGRREYERLMRAYAREDIRFIVVGGGEFFAPPEAHVERLGWRTTLSDVYPRSTVLIRFTAHDGLSLMTLEALTHGRHVLWTHDFPFVDRISSYDEMRSEIDALYRAHCEGRLEPQYDAATYVSQTYDPARCVRRIAREWELASDKRIAPVAAVEATQ